MRISVSSLTDFNNLKDEELDVSKISWYRVKAKLNITPQEAKEMQEAKQYQIKTGVLQPNGLPAGMSMNEYNAQREAALKAAGKMPQKEIITPQKAKEPEGKYARKRRRELERQAEKEKRKNNVNFTTPMQKRFFEQAKQDEKVILKKLLGA